MALGKDWTNIASGSQTINDATLTYYIDAYLSSQSIANNQSVCPTRARTVFSGYYMQSYGYKFTATGCTEKSGSGLYSFTTETVMTGSTTVTHNADGTGTLSVSGVCQGSGIGLSISVSGSVALPTIPRASSATFSASEITLNGSNSITVSIARASSSFTHTLKFTKGTVSQTVTGVGTSYTWTPTIAKWMPACSAKSNTVSVSLTTYNGSTQIGSAVSYTVKLNVDQSAYKPVISSITLSDTNTATSAVESSGSYIKGRSNLKAVVVFGVSNSSYVSLVGATITCGSDTRSITLSGTSSTQTVTFNAISATNFSVTVVDNRGVTATSTRTLTIIPYANVNVQSANYTRVNDNGEATEVGNRIKLRVVTSAFVGTFGQSANVQTLSYRYKLHSATSYSSWISLGTYSSSTGGSVTSHTFNVQPTEGFSYSSQYDVQVRVVDQFSTSTTSIVIHQGLPVTAYAQTHFDVYGKFHIHDRDDPTKYTEFGGVGYMPPQVVLTDCDDATMYGVRYIANADTTNKPDTGFYQIFVFPYSTTYRTQIAFRTNTTGAQTYMRSNNDNEWGPWREFQRVLPNLDTLNVTTKAVTHSGADGGSVTWTVFALGNYRIATCTWRASSNYAIDSSWGGMYYSPNIYTPNFPVTFSNVLYQSVRYIGADSALHAEAWDSGHQGAPSTTNFGYVYLVRPNDGGAVTVGHPRFAELIIGTV